MNIFKNNKSGPYAPAEYIPKENHSFAFDDVLSYEKDYQYPENIYSSLNVLWK